MQFETSNFFKQLDYVNLTKDAQSTLSSNLTYLQNIVLNDCKSLISSLEKAECCWTNNIIVLIEEVLLDIQTLDYNLNAHTTRNQSITDWAVRFIWGDTEPLKHVGSLKTSFKTINVLPHDLSTLKHWLQAFIKEMDVLFQDFVKDKETYAVRHTYLTIKTGQAILNAALLSVLL